MDIRLVVMDESDNYLEVIKLVGLTEQNVSKTISSLRDTFTRTNQSYHFETFKVGESRKFPAKKAMAAAYMYGRRTGKKFFCTSLSDGTTKVTRRE